MGYTQPCSLTPEEQQELRLIRIDQRKSNLRDQWNRQDESVSIAEHIMVNSDYRIALGVSDEQYQQIVDATHRLREPIQSRMRNNPEVQKIQAEIQTIIDRAPNPPPSTGGWHPRMLGLDDASLQRMSDLNDMLSSLQEIARTDACSGILTPEQERKARESYLANMGLLPIFSPRMFEGLSLTDAQKQQMKNLEKDFESELEKYLENFASRWIAFEDLLFGTLKKQEGTNLGERMQATYKILAGDPEYKRIMEEITSHHKAFAARFMTEMYERSILTDAQWARLQELFDNPPEHARVLGRVLRGQSGASGSENMGASENASEESGGWRPGPGSWRPGDALPVQIQERREGRFPREEE